MKTPPLLIGATLVFWGWQSGLLIPAIIMAVILEGSLVTRRRFELSDRDFNRISDLCALIFIAVAIYRYASGTRNVAVLVPMPFFPLMAAQAYSTRGAVSMSAVSWAARKRKDSPLAEKSFDVGWPYFGLTILAASAANMRTNLFFVAAFILIAWALWLGRPRGYGRIFFAALVLAAGAIGFAGQVGLHQLHRWTETRFEEWLGDYYERDRDPYRNTTAFGDVGKLKQSSRIIFRVNASSDKPVPELLQEASYNHYDSSKWLALRGRFEPVPFKAGVWRLNADDGEQSIRVTSYFRKGKGLLKLPLGACAVSDLPVGRMVMNRFGAVKAEEAPPLASYLVKYGGSSRTDNPPDDMDLEIPDTEKQALLEVAQAQGLADIPPEKTADRLYGFFIQEFAYTLELKTPPKGTTHLADFLLNRRAGHCEYFATATVLLLRACGIPARYATGYRVYEYDRFEDCFVVRTRHAHAWTLAYINGQWQNLDTTPPSWLAAEEDLEPGWQGGMDFLGWLWLKFNLWRTAEQSSSWMLYLAVGLGGILVVTLWRIFFKKQKVLKHTAVGTAEQSIESKKESPWFRIAGQLEQEGLARQPAESWTDWLSRTDAALQVNADALKPILAMHYRLRFDPHGLNEDEIETMTVAVSDWLDEYERRRQDTT
jgi:hypothetical protein